MGSGGDIKFGKLPPLPEDNDFSKWCPNDALEIGDQWIIIGFIGSCPNCIDGVVKGVPNEFLVQYLGDTEDGAYHKFIAIEDIRCTGCDGRMNNVTVLCQSKTAGIDVSKEFTRISKGK